MLMPLLRRLNGFAAEHLGVRLVHAHARPQPRIGRLPEGAAAYLTPDNPRLTELRERYASADPAVATPSIWHEDKIGGSDVALFRADNAYLWQTRGPNKSELSYALSYYATRAEDDEGLLDRLGEDDLFGAYVLEIDGRTVSRDLLDSVREIQFLKRHAGLDGEACNVLDIGAGYGRLAYRLHQATGDETRIFAVDAYPPSTFLCEFYLGWRGADRARTVPLDEVEGLLASTRIDIAVNVHSFSECTPEAIGWWVERLAAHRVRRLMVVPNEGTSGGARCETNDGRDMAVIFARFGYRAVVREPRYRDPVVQRHGIDPVHLHLFELG
jgi:SAM-dependent methyltransferase